MNELQLMRAAAEARKAAYAPYSHFRVGAALLTSDGRIFTGCNIENAAFTPSICAERTAISKAVSENVREFAAIAVVGGGEEEPADFCAPCGVCRQVMAEFCAPDFVILLGTPAHWERITLAELLPAAFTPADVT